MDRRLFLVVALLAVVALVVPAVAFAAPETLTGTVKSVKDMTAVVTDDAKKDHNVSWDAKTKVTGEVKAGAHVKVTHEGGKASAIEVLPAEKKK